MQRSSSYSNCTMLLVIIGQPRIHTKLASFKQILLEHMMNFRVKFRRNILRMRIYLHSLRIKYFEYFDDGMSI
ncbi:hypothetical protein YC2023_045964 [Brassica napus]